MSFRRTFLISLMKLFFFPHIIVCKTRVIDIPVCFCQSNQNLSPFHERFQTFTCSNIWVSWKVYYLLSGSCAGCAGLGTVHYRTANSRLGLLPHATLLAQSLQSHQHNGWCYRSGGWRISFFVFNLFLYFCRVKGVFHHLLTLMLF